MLNQLIYTRCYPHRDLKNGGNVVRADGFGLFSASEEVFSDPELSGHGLLNHRLSVKNAANEDGEIGLFDSYEYFSISHRQQAFLFEHARPHCKIPRKNGRTHRSGTYIKQCLFGQIEGYPYEWFGAEAWTAHLQSENDFYLDDPDSDGPPLLPKVSAAVCNGTVTEEDIRAFAADGRQEALKAAIWFVIQEFAKPEGERRVLLIKDTAAQVALWVAAIECAFSPEMARTITFATNRSQLGTQTEAALFYYTDEAGRQSLLPNHSIPQTRHPYCMIVGFDPKDSFCAAIKPLAAGSYVLIDGTTKTAQFPTEDLSRIPYYNAAVQYDDDILDFCRIVLPSLKLERICTELPLLYDAYKYLLDTSHRADLWLYADTLRHMGRLNQYGIPDNEALLHYLLDEVIAVYSGFMGDEIHNGFPLMKQLLPFAEATGRQQDLTGLIMDYTQQILSVFPTIGSAFPRLWAALKVQHMLPITKTALCHLMNDTELPHYAKRFPEALPVNVDILLEMFEVMLSMHRIPFGQIAENQAQYVFLCMGLAMLLKDRRLLARHMDLLRRTPRLLNEAATSVANYLNAQYPQKVADWWEVVILHCGSNLAEVCRNLAGSGKASIDLLEQLLTNRVEKAGQCDSQVLQALTESIRVLGATPETGIRLFTAWLHAAPLTEHSAIIAAAQSCLLPVTAQQRLFAMLDNLAPYTMGKADTYTAHTDMLQWAKQLGLSASAATLSAFKPALEQAKKPEAALVAIAGLLRANLPLRSGLLQSGYFAQVCDKATRLESPDVHIHLLCAFIFDESQTDALDDYIDTYLHLVLRSSHSHRILETMVALTAAVTFTYEVYNRTPEYVEEIRRRAELQLAMHFTGYYKPNMIQQVTKSERLEPEVKALLLELLREASTHAAPQAKNLFGWGKRD